MEALEKPKEKRMKSGGPHGTKSKSAVVDPAATHQHVRLRIKLPVSPARNLAGSTKGAKSTTGASVATNHEPPVSDLSDHKSSDTEPNSPAPEYQDFSNTSLKELRRRYEAKFGTATLSNNSDYLKRKLAGQCGPPRLRRSNADHDVTVDRSPKRSPTFRRRKVEDVLEPDARGVETEEELDLDLEDADGEDEDSDPDCGMQDGDASTPLKKQRSGRKDGGANQWTNQAEEIRRIVRKKRRNRAFPPQTLVWAKLEGRPWWPARVVTLEGLPESVLERKLVGWTCVEFYGLTSTDEQRFAWLKRENLASYKKFRKDFNEQKFPERFEDGSFQLALKEISEEAKHRRTTDSLEGTKSFREARDSSMELRSSDSSSSDEDAAEPPLLLLDKEIIDPGKKQLKHRAEIVRGKLKQMRMKKVHGLQAEDLKPGRSMWPIKGDEDHTPPKFKKTKDNGGDMTRKRKRLVGDEHQRDDSHGTSDEAEDPTMPDSPPKKAVSDSKFNRQSSGKKLSRSLSNAGDSVKVDKDVSRKPKRTGEDGYYYDCEVCGIGGELLCCDLCPRVYHLECLTPPLKRTPPGKWVCPTCRDRSGIMRSAGSSLTDARQQGKVKGVEEPSGRGGHKIFRKEKPIGPPAMLSDKHSKRKREDSDSKRRRKRAKSKGEEDGQRRLNCGYCGVETTSLRSSGLCDKCHSEIRAGTLDDNPSNSAPAECVEATQHEKDKQKSGRCDTCGERGVVISCENCSCAFHKDCVVPALRKTPKSPWFCSDCSSEGDYKLGDEQPSDGLSAEVHRILGCRFVGSQGPPLSGCVTGTEKDKQLKVDTSEVDEGNANGSVTNVLEGPGDAAGMEWKVVKRTQASDVNRTGGVQAAVPMEIDSVSNTGPGAAVENVQPKSADSEEESKTKIVVSESESIPERSSARTSTKEKSVTKSSSNGAIQVVEDPSFVIEIGGHDMNLNVRLPLDSVAKADGNVPNKEIGCAGLSNSVLLQREGATSKIKEIENRRDAAVVVVETPEKKANTESLCDHYATGTAGEGAKSPSLEFFVKWRGKSNIHNEWVSEERLQVIAKQELEKYKAKYGTAPLSIMDDQCLKAQRILARRIGKSGSAEVLVKWHCQPYDECTWEEERNPVIAKNLELLEVFERFEAAAVAKKANVMTNDNRPSRIEELTEQPEWLRVGGVLYPYQLEALNWLRKSWYRRKNVILADETGLGKTISACAFLSSLYREFHMSSPCLVLVPLSTIPKWLAELSLWAPFLNVIEYHGSEKARAVIREYEWYATPTGKPGDEGKHPDSQAIKFDVMLTSYEMVIADSSQLRSVPWEVLIADEGHKLKNSESKLFTILNTFKFGHRVLLTNTPLPNNLSETYNLLNFLQPETFPSRGALEEKFGPLGTAEQVDEVKKLVAPHMLRRLKKDAMQNISPIAERIVPVELTSVQAEYYRALLTKNYQLLRQVSSGKSGGHNQALLNIMMDLRKVCNHPYLLPGSEPEGGSSKFLHEMRIKASAKLTLLHSMLHHLKKGGHRVLILSQMTKLLDILEDYLSFEFGHQSFERVDESLPVAERQKAISRFNQDQSRFVFLLSTRSCGLGINLATADTVIIYDSEFNPHADIQAMNRAHQIGQSKTPLVYRLAVRGTVEERILQLARKKLMVEHLFANKSGSQKDVEDIIGWGTKELFAEERSEESCAVLNADNDAAEEVEMKRLDEKNLSGLDLEIKDNSEETMVFQDKSQKKVKPGKVVWDDAAVSRLLDRSELATGNVEVAKGDQESDWLGSLKTWTWNEPDGAEQVGSDEDAARNIEASENPLNSAVEEQNIWDELLRARWEKLQKEEEVTRGRGKRTQKNDSSALKSVEDSSESSEDELDGDHASEPMSKHASRAKQLLGKVRADGQDTNLGDDTLLSLAREGKPVSGSFKAPASTSSIPLVASLSQVATHDGHTEEWRPNLQGVHSNGSAKSSATQIPITIDLEDSPRTTPSINIINVEQSRNGNVSYPHRVYTVPGTPVGLAGEQSLASSKHLLTSSLLSREQIDPDLSLLRKQLDRGAQSSLSSQGIRQLLSPAIPGSSGAYGSVVHSNVRPLLFENVPGPRVSQAGSEERVFGNLGNRRHDAELQGLQPDLLQRAYAREAQNSAMLSTSGLSDVPRPSLKKEARDATGSMSMSEILRRVANKKGRSMLPPASTDGRNSSQFLSNDILPNVLGTNQSSQGSPNLSMSLGLGGLNLSSQDQALLVRALASHDSQNLARSHNQTGPSLGGPSSSGGSGDAIRVQVGDTLLASGAGDHHEGRTSDVGSRLLSGSQDMVGLQSVHKHEMGKKSSPFGESDARFEQGSQAEPWTEDELDSLWTGVRRLGVGNWAAMLLNQSLLFHKSRTAHDLAERWREEQRRLFGAPAAEFESKPGRQGLSPLSSGEDGVGQRYRDHTSAGEEGTVQKKKESAEFLFPKDTTDLSGTTTMVNQGLGANFGEFDRKQVLESLRAVDLSYRRSAGFTGNPAIDRVEYSKVNESSSALDLVNSVRSQVSTIRDGGSSSRSGLAMEGHTVEFDKWEGTTSRRRPDVAKEMLRQSQLQKTKLPASFLANLSFNQSADAREKQSQELRDQHTLPLLPQVPAPNLGLLGQSSFPHKASFGQQIQQDNFLPRGFHDSPRSHHDSRASSLSSTFAEMDKRRLKMGIGSSKNPDPMGPSEANQSLPHWLREAFKPDQPPPPKVATVSPMITAVSQATSFLYKDCIPFLPPFVHPGPLPAAPRRAAKKQRSRPAAGEAESGRGTEVLAGRNELNFLMSGVESTNPSLSSSLQQFASSLNAGFNTGGQPTSVPSSTSSFSKRVVDFSALPSLDTPAQSSFSRPSPALEELMSLRNLSSLPLAPGPPLNESVTGGLERSLLAQSSAQVLDSVSAGTNFVFSAKGDRHGRHRDSNPFPAKKHSPLLRRDDSGPIEATHSRRRKDEAPVRKRKSNAFPFATSNQLSSHEGSPDSPDPHRHRQDGSGESKLPSWMLAADVGAKSRQKASSKASSKHDGGNSSSETESDPRIRGAAGMTGDDDDDASSDETVSDDRTQ